MRIQKIAIKNYRNIRKAETTFADGINILFGRNANGKTNLLEAVYTFACGKSFRAKNPAETIMFGADGYDISLYYKNERSDIVRRMNVKLGRDKKRFYSRDGVACEKASDFIGAFRAVLFTPDHLSLVKGVPDGRRRFLDMAISQIRPVYISALNEYNRLLAQRSSLLKSMRGHGASDALRTAELDVWTEQLAVQAAAVTVYRLEYVNSLRTLAPGFYEGISGGGGADEQVGLSYLTQINRFSGSAEHCAAAGSEEILAHYTRLFAQRRADELRYGTSLFGPHRDDITITIGGRDAKTVASQGQQRSIVLALKLAEGEAAKKAHGEYPVFLFDDILSELDSERQKYILRQIGERQVIITCPNRELLGGIPAEAVTEVDGGVFTRCRD